MIEWKYIKGYGKRYMISNTGVVKSFVRYPSGKVMELRDNGLGYKYIGLSKNKKQTPHYIHRLVAENFLEHSDETEVNHIDCDKSNNRLDNLEWCTKSDNHKHAYKMGKKWQLNNAPA